MITFIAASNADTRGGLEYFADILTSEGTTLQPEELEESEMLSANELDDLVYACLRAYGLLYASVYGDGRGTWEDAWDESQAEVSHILDWYMFSVSVMHIQFYLTVSWKCIWTCYGQGPNQYALQQAKMSR